MRSAQVWMGMGLAMLAFSPAFAEHAEHRGGSGGSTSAKSEEHHAEHAAPKSDPAPVVSRTDSAPAQDRQLTEAEKRHPAAGTGDASRGHFRGGGYHRGGHDYRPYYEGSVFVGYGCYDCGLYDVYPWYYPRYHYRYYDASPAVRIQVEPDKARVYVDGYYAGIVDDFDGLFQRLYVAPGRHEIALKLEGYRTHRFTLYGVPGRTIKLHYDMVRGSGDDAAEVMAGVPPEDVAPPPPADDRDRDRDRPESYDDRPSDRHDLGTLSLDVRPRDAAVYIDGQIHPEAVRDDVRLAAGTHRVEVVRPGYRSFERDVEIRPGKTADVDVHLEK